MPGFDRIIGQELAKSVLLRSLNSGDISQSYLFLGPKGSGKTTVAMELAKSANCESPVDGQACGECAVCHAIDHGNSPDIRVWSPIRQYTVIDQMREMRDLASFAPSRNKWRINIIEQADTMNEEAANCILKLVEEPPPYLINILLYRSPAAVLATIKSRCQVIRFTQVHADELSSRLVSDYNLSSERAELLAVLSQGCPGKAIGLIDDSDFFARRDAVIAIAQQAASASPWGALRLAENLRAGAAEDSDSENETIDEAKTSKSKPSGKPKDLLSDNLDILAVWYRDLMVYQSGSSEKSIVNNDRREEIESQSRFYSRVALEKILALINRTKSDLRGNANPQIATEALMAKIAIASGR